MGDLDNINSKLDKIQWSVDLTSQRIYHIMSAIDDVNAALAAIKTAVGAAVTEIQALALEVATGSSDPDEAALEATAASLNTLAANLTAAVNAASPTPSTPVATSPTVAASPQASSAPTTTSGGSETAEQTATDFSLAFGQAKVHVNALFTFLHNTGNAADLDLQGLETHLRALLAPMRTLLSKT